jgi:anti-sigma B factor antagonist
MNLTTTTRKLDPDVDIVELAGRLTLGRDNVNLEHIVANLLAAGARKIVLDLSEVHYVDSSGVGSIALSSSKATQSGARLAAAGAKGMVLEVFRMTRVDLLVPFFPDIPSAVSSFTT